MLIEPIEHGLSIVLLGQFNPSIFTPHWLAHTKLIEYEDADEASVKVIHPEISVFEVGQFLLTVQRERFAIDTKQAPLIAAFDFVRRIFGEFLHHTPIQKIGMNKYVHFSVGSTAIRNEIGKRLAPFEPWGEFGNLFETQDLRKSGGILSLTMLANIPDDMATRRIRAKVEPSNDPRLLNKGIFIEVNDDYEVTSSDGFSDASIVMYIMEHRFDNFLEISDEIIGNIMNLKDEVARTVK